MPEAIAITVNGKRMEVPQDTTALAAILASGAPFVRRSVHGEPRGALCGMGICFECRVTINGVRHCRSCTIVCEHEMDIRTDE
jgi:aerobic-type carbon monoxide dehydrogenase small subunit (CoxS/CutS family)